MPTPRQVERVLTVKGMQYVDPERVPNLTQRYTETYIRRRLFALEDRTIIETMRMYQATFRAIRAEAEDLADRFGIRNLANDATGLQWRRVMLSVTVGHLNRLAQDVARYSFERVVLSYMVAFYGKLWMLDSMLPNENITISRLDSATASQLVLRNPILEDVSSQIIYDTLGVEWREQYADHLTEIIPKIRRRLNRGMGDGETIRELMGGVADILGVTTDRRRTGIADVRANFNRVQTMTRSYFIHANNQAALDSYRDNQAVVSAVQWLTARDSRVCPECEALEGQVWKQGDSDQLIPVVDTHFNCRCSLIPVVDERFFQADDVIPDDAPPPSDYEGWLDALGIAFLLKDFFDDPKTVTSTRE